MLPKAWKTLSSRLVYKNHWMRVREDTAELPNGRTTIYGVCELGRAVGVLPFVDDDHVIMVRQYRYVQKASHRWEMPTGGVRSGESLEQAAQRELMEEIGFRAGVLREVNTHWTSKSVVDETATVFLGRDLVRVDALPDETEFLQVDVFAFGQVLEMVLTGEIRDSMTVIAVLLAALDRNKGGQL